MKYIFSILIYFVSFISLAQVKIGSWNIKDMGRTKTSDQIECMANILRDFDVIALQEVVAGFGGTQSVAKLADELNRKGGKWLYTISNPTVSSPYSSERYAYLWKPSKVALIGKAWLNQNYVNEIEREPFMVKFLYKKDTFTIVSFHAIPKTKQPEREIKYFKFFPDFYKNEKLIFLGDFNVSQKNNVFNPLKKMGYVPVLKKQKTTLRTKCLNDGCLASAYDNIFFNGDEFELLSSGTIHFYKKYKDFKKARKLSDHVPVFAVFSLK